MENWGLVTYRETALLVDPNQSSSSAKQWVALVVGHELAHQWFGNLVTMVSASKQRCVNIQEWCVCIGQVCMAISNVMAYSWPIRWWFHGVSSSKPSVFDTFSASVTLVLYKTFIICVRIVLIVGMVDALMAEWRLCLVYWVPVCRSLLPWVWYLDSVCQSGSDQGPAARRSQK